MTSDGIDPNEMAELLSLPSDDPRRRRFEGTPRGRAILSIYASFMEAANLPGANPAAADHVLAEALARALNAPNPKGGASSATGAEPRRELRWPGILRALMSPTFRPAFALASIAIVLGGLWLARSRPGPQTRLLRGAVVGGQPVGTQPLELHEARTFRSGAIQLSWAPYPGADRYVVSFLRPDLTDLFRLPAGPDAGLTIGPGALPALLPRGQRIGWRVVARHGGDSLAVSTISAFRLP